MILYRYSPASDLLRLLDGSLAVPATPVYSGAFSSAIDWDQLDLHAGQLLEHPVAELHDLARSFLTTRRYPRLRADAQLFLASFDTRGDSFAQWESGRASGGFAVGICPEHLLAASTPKASVTLARCGQRSVLSALEILAAQLRWPEVAAEARTRTAVLAFVAAHAMVRGSTTTEEHRLLVLANRAHQLPELAVRAVQGGRLLPEVQLPLAPRGIVEIVYHRGSEDQARALALTLRQRRLNHVVIRASGSLCSASAQATSSRI